MHVKHFEWFTLDFFCETDKFKAHTMLLKLVQAIPSRAFQQFFRKR